MKILVVDDEKLLVKGIKFKLENDEYQLYRIPFRTPDDVNRFLGRGRLILTLKTTQATIEIKGLTLVRKPAEK